MSDVETAGAPLGEAMFTLYTRSSSGIDSRNEAPSASGEFQILFSVAAPKSEPNLKSAFIFSTRRASVSVKEAEKTIRQVVAIPSDN
jgi:hypothetical protein